MVNAVRSRTPMPCASSRGRRGDDGPEGRRMGRALRVVRRPVRSEPERPTVLHRLAQSAGTYEKAVSVGKGGAPMRAILAIDPGTTQSAYVHFDADAQELIDFDIVPNAELGRMLDDPHPFRAALIRTRHCVIEMVQSFGMPVGRDVFETVYWVGRFAHAWDSYPALTHQQLPTARIYRGEIKQHLCHNAKAKDPNIRQALMDRFGGDRSVSIGTKKAPGPLFGVKSHLWAALAVAVTYADKHLPAKEGEAA
jgi:hypothetical protein